jgi:hypothetical protein
MNLSKTQKIALIGGGIAVVGLLAIYVVYRLIRKKMNTIIVEGTFKGANCDELHAFEGTHGKTIGGMNTKVNAELQKLYESGINPDITDIWVEMNASKMEVKWRVTIQPSKDGKAYLGLTSRGGSGASAYDRANGKSVGQDADTILKKVKDRYYEPNAELVLVKDFLYNLNTKKQSLGKCPTRQLFYKYTKPKAFPKH